MPIRVIQLNKVVLVEAVVAVVVVQTYFYGDRSSLIFAIHTHAQHSLFVLYY